MEQQNFLHKVKDFLKAKKEGFIALKKGTKIAIVIGVIAIILSTIFSISYAVKNKYDILFSGLDSIDAANISKELESRSVDTKIEGDIIYVPKKEVDKLRLELSPSISNGSQGFEIMDNGSGFGITDEEFQLKKQRMMQGEIEKTIKTFPQVETARVHITEGESSVFSKENKPGQAAVYLGLKSGQTLQENQIRSIISLVSASSHNVPKETVEVIDQNMTLLSEGLYDENGNATNGSKSNLESARQAEKELNEDLQKSINNMLEPIFGKGKVKVSVNSDLNFDSSEKTEIKIDPEKVIKSESRSENSSSDSAQSGSPVDNNMSNTGQGNGNGSSSKEENIEYEVGKIETKTITTVGEVKRITTSVAIDGVVNAKTIENIESMVAGAIGMDTSRGDDISVVAMEFDAQGKAQLEEAKLQEQKELIFKLVAYLVGGILLLIAIILVASYISKKKNEKELAAIMEGESEETSLNFIDENSESLTLEEEVKLFASKNPEEVTELIKIWLNE